MAKTSLRLKAARPPKFEVQRYNRCLSCGRARGFFRKFKLCRICLRKMALSGLIPGVTKASW